MLKPWQYPPPLDRLFTLGEPEWGTARTVPDYVAELGLTREHVPALVEIVRLWEDEDNLPEGVGGSAPIHAWRALGQLRAVEAVQPLLDMQNLLDTENDDWYLDEYPEVFGRIGPPAIAALAAYLADSLNREYPRISAADGLLRIAEQHPESRDEVVDLLARQIARCEQGVYDLNAFIIGHLVKLKATEAAEPIERAFAAGVVEADVRGDWGEVRKELGVPGMGLAPDESPRPKTPSDAWFHGDPFFVYDAAHRERQRAAEKKTKAKRKQQEKARKRNRNQR